MKILKYGSVFKKVAGGSASIAIEKANGFSLTATIGHQSLGMIYTGPNNRMFIKDMKADKNWKVGEMDEIDFQVALHEAFDLQDGGLRLKRLDLYQLPADVAYATKLVDPKSAKMFTSLTWLKDGWLYGTNGHAMHRVREALPSYEKAYGFSPTMLGAFLSLVLFDKKTAWAGVVETEKGLRLVGGNDNVNCWLDTGFLEGETCYEIMLAFFERAKESIDVRVDDGAFLIEQKVGALKEAIRLAPRTGEDGEYVGLAIYPDRILFLDEKHLPEESSGEIYDVLVAPGKHHLRTGLPIKTLVNHKYLMQALDVPQKVSLLTMGGDDYLWMGDTRHTAIMMPISFWPRQDSPMRRTVREQAEFAADEAEFTDT